jgi:hypothetical protein
MPQTYWLDLFTVETWKEFLDHGGDVTGFREKRWKIVQKIKHGDYLLCHLTGASRWVGLLEVTSEPVYDETTAAKVATAQTTAAVVKRIARSPLTDPPRASPPRQHRWMLCAGGSPSCP